MNLHREPTTRSTRANPLQVHWLVRLRWAAVIAQIASIVGVKYLLRAPFALPPLALIVGCLATLNIIVSVRMKNGWIPSESAVSINLMIDIAALTGLLIWTGGAMNPFTTLYLLQVALAAILVGPRWSLLVTATAITAFGGLLLARPEAIHVWHSASMFMLHVRGMWFAFALTATCLWFFVERVSTSLQQREHELALARLTALRAERIAALGTLAAGTAHELNTPLGTVAILASELAETLGNHPVAQEQANRIRSEIRRCSQILIKMRSHEPSVEPQDSVVLAPWLNETVKLWNDSNPRSHVDVNISLGTDTIKSMIRSESLRQAIYHLLDNARLASGTEDASIAIELNQGADGAVKIAVVDHGVGIVPENLAHVGEPFFTTREPGQGMGLGLYLVQSTIEEHGGTFAVRSKPGETRIELSLTGESKPIG